MTGTLSVCHLIATNFAGGPEKQILELSKRLRDRDIPVTIASFLENRDRVELLDNARAEGLGTFVIDTRSSFSLGAVSQLREQVARLGSNVLVTHGYKANLVGRLASMGSNLDQVPMIRGYTRQCASIRAYEAVDRWLLRSMPRILCVSHATRRILMGHGVKGDRIHVLHNAVNCSVEVDPVDLRAEYGLPVSAKVLVAAGRLSPEKAHIDLVRAMAAVREREPDARLLVFGEGDEQGALEAEIGRLDLGAHVQLAGFRRNIPGCLAGADLVVNPSHTEGLPNVILEAMSAGTAAVATDVGGCSELIEPGQNGWLVAPEDPPALAAAIVDALGQPALCAQFAEASREKAVREFSFENQASRFVELCGRLTRATTSA